MYDFGRGGSNVSATFDLSNFNWTNPNFFYSRRIGRAPQGNPVHFGFIDKPEGAPIIGAGKLTGKISEGWLLGFLNAVTARTHAEVDSAGVRFEDEIEPLTYYGVLRSAHDFNNGAQSIGIISTATVRDIRDENLSLILNKNAFTLGADGWTFLDASRMWVVTGWMGTSVVWQPAPSMKFSVGPSFTRTFDAAQYVFQLADPMAPARRESFHSGVRIRIIKLSALTPCSGGNTCRARPCIWCGRKTAQTSTIKLPLKKFYRVGTF